MSAPYTPQSNSASMETYHPILNMKYKYDIIYTSLCFSMASSMKR
jgi:hypothetical protein